MKEFRGHSFHQTENGHTGRNAVFFATHEAIQMCAIATKREPFLLGFSSFAVDALLSFWDSDILRCWRYEKRRFTVCAVVNSHFLCEIACKELRFLGLLSQFSLMPLGFHRLLVMFGGGILGIPTNNFLTIKVF